MKVAPGGTGSDVDRKQIKKNALLHKTIEHLQATVLRSPGPVIYAEFRCHGIQIITQTRP